MTNRLAGKTALVSAAGQGIGRETSLAFARQGAKVIATDIDDDLLASLHDEMPVIRTRHLDVTDADNINEVQREFPDIGVLFNCAGYVHQGSLLDCDEQTLRFSIELNVVAMYRMVRAFLPPMLERRSGTIINMSSVASSITGAPNRFAYGVTKAAVIGLTKSIASDYVAFGIRCNAICPGTVQTPSLDDRINAFDDPVAARQSFIDRQPMGRLGRVEEIAHLAVYLASDESAYTTGAAHIVDGGWTN